MARIVDGNRTKDDALEVSLRPQTLKEYVGQSELKRNLEIFISCRYLSKRQSPHRSSDTSKIRGNRPTDLATPLR